MELQQLLYQQLNNDAIAVSEKYTDWSYDSFVRHAFYARDYFINNKISKVIISLPQGFYAYSLTWGAYLAGTAFCPINKGIPEDRFKYYIDQFVPDLILTEENVIVESEEIKTINPISFYDDLVMTDIPKQRNICFDPGSAAYVIFTSGSTGLPKGVILSRLGLENLIQFSTTEFEAAPGDVWGQFSNLGFDLSVCDIFTAIICRATLVPVASAAEKLLPGLTIKNKKITIWHSVPSVIDLMNKTGQLTSQVLGGVKTMIFAGERLFPSQLTLLFNANPDMIIYNCYGPTESTIFCTYQRLTSKDYMDYCDHTVSIGQPLPGYEIILKSQGDDGCSELLVRGKYIGTGYLGNKGAAYPFEFTESDGMEIWSYSTGDFVKYHDNNLYYISRKDSQIKIKGYRVDLTEIDYWLREFGCTACVSVFSNDKITSFVVCGHFTEPDIRAYLEKKLPSYYLPAQIINKTFLPHNQSGKIDANQLIAELTYNHIS